MDKRSIQRPQCKFESVDENVVCYEDHYVMGIILTTSGADFLHGLLTDRCFGSFIVTGESSLCYFEVKLREEDEVFKFYSSLLKDTENNHKIVGFSTSYIAPHLTKCTIVKPIFSESEELDLENSVQFISKVLWQDLMGIRSKILIGNEVQQEVRCSISCLKILLQSKQLLDLSVFVKIFDGNVRTEVVNELADIFIVH